MKCTQLLALTTAAESEVAPSNLSLPLRDWWQEEYCQSQRCLAQGHITYNTSELFFSVVSFAEVNQRTNQSQKHPEKISVLLGDVLHIYYFCDEF